MIDDMETLAAQTNKIQAARTSVKIKADASGNLPASIEIVPAGSWPNSWKGNLEISIDDLQEMAANFANGVGLPDGGSEGAPIDYSHADYERAAGWITAVRVDGGRLVGDIEWTPAAAQAIRDGEFKFVSPSFYPKCLGNWADPENPTVTASNVLVGAGLTNIPFFKGLKGLKASQSGNDEDSQNVIYISASQEGETQMTKTLEEIRKTPANEIANLSEDDKKLLSESKDQLTADEQVAFGLVEKAEEKKEEIKLSDTITPTEETVVAPADVAAVTASIKAGTHKLVATSELEGLKASVQAQGETIKQYQRERIDANVAKHVARGAIKADQAEAWGNKIEADASTLDLLSALPDNKVLASEIGDSQADAQMNASSQLDKIANEAVKASVVNGKPTVEYADAITAARKSNPELAQAADAEAEGK